jgi:hypothetical protein
VVFRRAHAAATLSDSRVRQQGLIATRHLFRLRRRDTAGGLFRGFGPGISLVVHSEGEMVHQGLHQRGTGLGAVPFAFRARVKQGPFYPNPRSLRGRRYATPNATGCVHEFTARNRKPTYGRRDTSLVLRPNQITEPWVGRLYPR